MPARKLGRFGRDLLAALGLTREEFCAKLELDADDADEYLSVQSPTRLSSPDTDIVWLRIHEYVGQRIAGCMAVRALLDQRLEDERKRRLMRHERIKGR